MKLEKMINQKVKEKMKNIDILDSKDKNEISEIFKTEIIKNLKEYFEKQLQDWKNTKKDYIMHGWWDEQGYYTDEMRCNVMKNIIFYQDMIQELNNLK